MTKRPPVRQDEKRYATEADLDPMLREQKEARAKRAAKTRRAARPRMTYDLPQELIDQIKVISQQESVSQSDLAEWALSEFVARYQAGEVNLDPHKVHTQSLRYVWALELPKELRL